MADIVRFPLNELELESYNLSDTEKDKIVLVLQGRALKNPCQTLITAALAAIDVEITAFEDLGGSHSFYSSNEVSQIVSKFESLKTAINKFKTHTDIISGVAISYTGFPPNLLGRIGIANSYQALRESLRKKADGPCGVEESKSEIFTDMFRSILGYGETELENRISEYTGVADRSELGDVEFNDLLSSIQTAITTFNNFKTNENAAFFKAYNFVVKVGVAQAVVSGPQDDFTDRLYKNVIGTNLFNSDNLDQLKIQCQTWFADSTTPTSDFSSNFSDEFVLQSIGDLVDMDLGSITTGYILQYATSGFTNVSFASSGICLDDLCNVSGAASASNGEVLIYDSVTGFFSPGAQSGGGGAGATGATGAQGTTGADSFPAKGITIFEPTNTDDITMIFTDEEITVNQLNAVVRGTTPSATWTIRFAADRSATGTEVVTGGTTTTSESTGSEVTSFNNATIPAGSWIWIEVSAISGTVDELHITVRFGV